jgi:hypothetical protein
MGVEYRHYLIPENPSFVPASGVIKRIDAVLEKWKLKGGDPVIYNLSQEGLSVVKAPLHSLIFGQGFGVRCTTRGGGGSQLPQPGNGTEIFRLLAYSLSYRLWKRSAGGAR